MVITCASGSSWCRGRSRGSRSCRSADVTLRDRHAPAEPKRTARHFDPGRGLLTFVFVQINAPLNPAHRFLVKANLHDVSCAEVLLDVETQDFIENVVGRQRVLIDLTGLQL